MISDLCVIASCLAFDLVNKDHLINFKHYLAFKILNKDYLTIN